MKRKSLILLHSDGYINVRQTNIGNWILLPILLSYEMVLEHSCETHFNVMYSRFEDDFINGKYLSSIVLCI